MLQLRGQAGDSRVQISSCSQCKVAVALDGPAAAFLGGCPQLETLWLCRHGRRAHTGRRGEVLQPSIFFRFDTRAMSFVAVKPEPATKVEALAQTGNTIVNPGAGL